MQINKNSFHFKWLYSYAPWYDSWRQASSLCPYFWTCVFMLFLGWPVFGGMIVPAWLTLSCGMWSFFWVFGYKPDHFPCGNPDDYDLRHTPLFGTTWLRPWHILVLILLIYLPTKIPYAIHVITGIAWATFLLLLIALFATKAKRTETGKLVSEFIHAKKSKVCPIVEFVDLSDKEG